MMRDLFSWNVRQENAVKRPSSQRSPGCGLLEAVFWTVGYLVAQGVVLAALLSILLIAAYGFSWPGQEEIVKLVLDLDLDRSFLLIGATSLGVFFIVVPAVCLREGVNFRQRLGWRTPTHDELIYALATVAPTAILGDMVYDVASTWWNEEASLWPFAAALRESSLEHIYRSFQGVPYPILVVALALGPAVGEELVFRGVLGRRLVARFGVFWGVVMASACFALAHGSVPHIIATFPVAVLLHLVYLLTGTIWVPILVHFCNNLLAISMVRFQLGTDAPISPALVLSMCFYLGMILLLLHARNRGWLSDRVGNGSEMVAH